MYNGSIEPISDQFPIVPEGFFHEKEKQDEDREEDYTEAD